MVYIQYSLQYGVSNPTNLKHTDKIMHIQKIELKNWIQSVVNSLSPKPKKGCLRKTDLQRIKKNQSNIWSVCRLRFSASSTLMEPMLAGLQQESPMPCHSTTGVAALTADPIVASKPIKLDQTFKLRYPASCGWARSDPDTTLEITWILPITSQRYFFHLLLHS